MSLPNESIDDELEKKRTHDPENLRTTLDPAERLRHNRSAAPADVIPLVSSSKMGSPDEISALEQSSETFARSAPEVSHGALRTTKNHDESLSSSGSAIDAEETLDESEDEYTEKTT